MLEKNFQLRVYPTGPVVITFSNTRDQMNHTVAFLIENTKIEVHHNGTEIDKEASSIKYNAINILEIKYSKTQIVFDRKIQVLDDFHALKFISFKSTKHAVWIVQQSKYLLVDDIINFLNVMVTSNFNH